MGSCVLQSENKMKLIVFLATIVLVSAKSIKIDQLEYGFCEGADTSVGSIDNADVQPFPVEVKTGATVTISATLSLAAEVPVGATVSLNIVKEGIVDLPIPCLEIEGLHIGSGTYGGDPPVSVEIPEIPDLIAGFLASGTYYADATINYADGTMMTCLYVRIEVVG